MSSGLLTRDVAITAVHLAHAVMMSAGKLDLLDDPMFYAVIIDPTVPFHEEGFREEVIIYKGASETRAEKFQNIALYKAEVSWKYKMSSKLVQVVDPHLFINGMTKWGGGVFCHGIPVGVSGLREHEDEWLAELIAINCAMLCRREMLDIMQRDSPFVGID